MAVHIPSRPPPESIPVINWIRDRIRLPAFATHQWTDEHTQTVYDFITQATINKLFAYIDEDLHALVINCFSIKSHSARRIQQMQFFIKTNAFNNAPATADAGAAEARASMSVNTTDAAAAVNASAGVLTLENISASVQYGLLSGTPLESLLRHMQSVYLPTFLKTSNWPESVKKDMTAHTHKFMAALTETANSSKGHTVLYVPTEPQLADPDQAISDPDLIQRLETTLIHWTRQIKDVVSHQETSPSTDATGPLEEIHYWRSRTVDLTGLRAQLDRAGVQSIVTVLRLAHSSYVKPFETLSEMIAAGSAEANDNLLYLTAMQPVCEQLTAAAPADIPPLLPTILEYIRMVWTASTYYNTEERLTALLRKVSNQLIIQCSKYISLTDLFDHNTLHCMQVLNESIHTCLSWHQAFEHCVRLVAHDKTVQSWSFDAAQSGIFAQLDAFMQRCQNLLEIGEGQMQFARKNLLDFRTTTTSATQATKKEEEEQKENLNPPSGDLEQKENGDISISLFNNNSQASVKVSPPLPQFGGSRGADLQKSLIEIEIAFDKHLDRLRHLDYDLLNVKASHWHYDYNQFKLAMKDLEVMMSNVMASGWDDVTSVRAGVDLLENFYHLCIRSGMRAALERKVNDVYNMFQSEIKRTKTEFDRSKKDPPLCNGQPRYSGSALWARALIARLSADHQCLVNAAYLGSQAQKAEALSSYTAVVNTLETYVRQCHLDWVETLHAATADGSSLMVRLQRPLLVRHETNHLSVNFDPFLLQTFSEVRHWQYMSGDYPIPYTAMEMYNQGEALRITRQAVHAMIRDYNTALDLLTVDERRLFAEHIRRLDRKMSPGLHKLKWNDKHIREWYVKHCRLAINNLLNLINSFHIYIHSIQLNCMILAQCSLIDIEKNIVYDDTTFLFKQQQHVIQATNILTNAHLNILNIIKNVYNLTFLDHPLDVQREWNKFVIQIDDFIEDSLRYAVKRSISELSRAVNGDSKHEAHPLFRVGLLLDEQQNKILCKPSLQEIATLIQKVSKQSIATIQCVPPLWSNWQTENNKQQNDAAGGAVRFEDASATAVSSTTTAATPAKSFYALISSDDEIGKMLKGIQHGTTTVEGELAKLMTHYDRYTPIWNTDKMAFIRRYANTKRPLSSFDMDIQRYKNHQSDIQAEDNVHNVNLYSSGM